MNASRTLEQLEAFPWPPAPSDSSPLVQRCHALRKVSLANLAPGDLRVLIGQEVGPKHLVPLALAVLEREPLIEGDYFPGDLLLALTRLPSTFWSVNPGELERLKSVASRAAAELSTDPEPLGANVKLLKDVNAFIQQHDV